MQNDFVSDDGFFGKTGGGAGRIQAIVPAVQTLVEHAVGSGVLVVWLRFTSLPAGASDSAAYPLRRMLRQSSGLGPSDVVFCRQSTWGWEISEKFAPDNESIIVDKLRASGFLGTPLEIILRANSIESVVVCGGQTDGCVLFTAFDSLQLGFFTVVVEDAVADFSQEKHDSGLSVLRRRVDLARADEIYGTWSA